MHFWVFNYEFPPLGGGAGRACQRLFAELCRRRHRTTVITSAFDQAIFPTTTVDGLQVIQLPCGRKSPHTGRAIEMLRYAWAAARWASSTPHAAPDVVISYFALPSGLAGDRAAQRFGVSHLISLRGMDVPGFDRANLRPYHWLLKSPLLGLAKRASLLLPNSRALADQMRRAAGGTRLPPQVILPNGITPREALAPRALHMPLRLLAVGRFVRQKGFENLIGALADRTLRERCWHLDLVGDGPLAARLRHMAHRWGIAHRLAFHGWLNEEQLLHRYESAHFLVQPSLDEGSSNVLLEAMAQGLPAASTAVGEAPGILRHRENGLILTSPSKTDLTRDLNHLMDWMESSPQVWPTLRHRALHSIRPYSWSRIADDFEGLLTRPIYRDRAVGSAGRP